MKHPANTVYLVDSSIYVFRAWQGLPDTITDTQGYPVNALYGFADFLAQVVSQTNARYLVCAFDKSLRTAARNKIYPEYKANRPPAPANLKRQFGLCQSLVETAGFKQYSHAEYEADDIIGTLAESARSQGMQASIISADKDLKQFIRTGDEYWNFARDQRESVLSIKNRFGVRPEQIADLLALCGDRVDNIPGIPGVGAATAAKLLKKWGSLDNLLDNAEGVAMMKFKGAARVSALLRQHEKTVRLARQLTGLLVVDDLPDNVQELRRTDVDESSMRQLLTDNGFSDRRQDRLVQSLREA